MSLLDPEALGLEDAQEPKILAKGTEAQCRIIKVTSGSWKDKENTEIEHEYYSVLCEAMDHPFSRPFNHMITLPDSNMDEKTRNRNRWEMKCFLGAIEDLDTTRAFDPKTELKGKTFWAILGIKESDEYGDQNSVKKFVGAR